MECRRSPGACTRPANWKGAELSHPNHIHTTSTSWDTGHPLPGHLRAMSASKTSQRLLKIAAAWPIDPFRPNIQLKTFLQSLASHPNLTPRAVQAAQGLLDNSIQKKVRTLV